MSYLQDTPKKKKRRSRALLPLMGLSLAVLLGIVAFFVAPLLVDFIGDQDQKYQDQFADFEEDYGKNTVDYLFAGIIWLIMLALLTFVAAAAVGQDVETKEVWKQMGPHPADKKAVAKARKRAQKEAEKLAKQKKRAQKK